MSQKYFKKYLTSIAIWAMQIYYTQISPYCVRLAKIKKQHGYTCQRGCGKRRTHVHCHEEGKLVHPQFKSMCSLLGKILEIYLVYELYHSRAYTQRTFKCFKFPSNKFLQTTWDTITKCVICLVNYSIIRKHYITKCFKWKSKRICYCNYERFHVQCQI